MNPSKLRPVRLKKMSKTFDLWGRQKNKPIKWGTVGPNMAAKTGNRTERWRDSGERRRDSERSLLSCLKMMNFLS